jgi:hypothetical protein
MPTLGFIGLFGSGDCQKGGHTTSVLIGSRNSPRNPIEDNSDVPDFGPVICFSVQFILFGGLLVLAAQLEQPSEEM